MGVVAKTVKQLVTSLFSEYLFCKFNVNNFVTKYFGKPQK